MGNRLLLSKRSVRMNLDLLMGFIICDQLAN